MLNATAGRRVALLRSLHSTTARCHPTSGGGVSTNASVKATVPTRPKSITAHERAQLRSNRRQQATEQQSQPVEGAAATVRSSSNSNSATTTNVQKPMDPRLVFGVGVGLPTALLAWGIVDEESPPARLSKLIGLTGQIESWAEGFAKPSREKLLPDWQFIPNVPKDIPPPHTLVLDLEKTLVMSTWDRQNGWRHAKRPGVDKFLAEMAQYYEIVLYSPSQDGYADEVVTKLDHRGCIMHRLYRTDCWYQKGIYMKDLGSLNRNLNKVILLDDEESAAALFPDHLIKVKPYDDPKNRSDRTLERITPFLIEIARENYDDIPMLLRQFKGLDADGIADELERRVDNIKASRMRGARRGLGAFSGGMALPEPEMTPVPESRRGATSGQAAPPGGQMTAKDVAGAATSMDNSSSGSGLGGWMKRRQKEQEEMQMRKMEKWNEIMMKKQEDKQRAAQQAA